MDIRKGMGTEKYGIPIPLISEKRHLCALYQ